MSKLTTEFSSQQAFMAIVTKDYSVRISSFTAYRQPGGSAEKKKHTPHSASSAGYAYWGLN